MWTQAKVDNDTSPNAHNPTQVAPCVKPFLYLKDQNGTPINCTPWSFGGVLEMCQAWSMRGWGGSCVQNGHMGVMTHQLIGVTKIIWSDKWSSHQSTSDDMIASWLESKVVDFVSKFTSIQLVTIIFLGKLT